MIKVNQNIKPLNISSHDFLYIAYADDTTFFNRNKNSVIELLNVFDIFSVISGLKPNKSRCDTAGNENLKEVYVALCGLKCINLMNETVKILRCHFSYNITLQQENNFEKHLSKIENILKVWTMRNLTLSGKINVFKSLAISKITLTPIAKDIINLLNTIQKHFLWKSKYPKIKHETLCKHYKQGGLKALLFFPKLCVSNALGYSNYMTKIFTNER